MTWVKWSDGDDASTVVWVTGTDEESEAESGEDVMEEVGTFPVSFSEDTKKI